MALYFDRTLRETSCRTITLRDLRTELRVYLWTSFSDFLREHCSFQIPISKLDACDERQSLDEIRGGLPEAVVKLWKEWTDIMIGLLL